MSSPNPSEVAGALLSKELLAVLDELFPLRLPDPKDSERDIWIKVGQRQVIEKLHAWHAAVEADSYRVLDNPNVPLP